MLDYALLEALGAVIRQGSFDKAAAALSITPSAVSQRIKLLEERVGCVLVRRGQPCRATETGALLCRHLERVDLMEADLRRQMPATAGGDPAGDGEEDSDAPWPTLRIAVNDDSMASWFIPAVAGFALQRRILLDVVIDDQDHTARLLKEGAVQGAVTTEAKPVQGCRILKLGTVRNHAVCSPAFHRRYFAGRGGQPALGREQLRRAPNICFNHKDNLQRVFMRKLTREAPEPPTHWLPNANGYMQAYLGGLGWGMCPEHLAAPHLKSGALVELAPGKHLDLALYWQSWRLSIDLLDAFTDALRTGAKHVLR